MWCMLMESGTLQSRWATIRLPALWHNNPIRYSLSALLLMCWAAVCWASGTIDTTEVVLWQYCLFQYPTGSWIVTWRQVNNRNVYIKFSVQSKTMENPNSSSVNKLQFQRLYIYDNAVIDQEVKDQLDHPISILFSIYLFLAHYIGIYLFITVMTVGTCKLITNCTKYIPFGEAN